MAWNRSRMADRLLRGMRRRRVARPPALSPPEVAPAPARGLGEPSAPAPDEAEEAELDTLRGELVRELDRMAEGDKGSGAFRRVAS